LEDEPQFLPGTSPPLETLLSLFRIYFFDRLPWDRNGRPVRGIFFERDVRLKLDHPRHIADL
jgi:hypothetical protein